VPFGMAHFIARLARFIAYLTNCHNFSLPNTFIKLYYKPFHKDIVTNKNIVEYGHMNSVSENK
jgi:hypothetical protein